MRWLFVLLFGILAVSLTAQSKVVEKFIKKHPELQDYYVYQSTLRAINQEGDPDFNRLIKNIRKINVYIAEGNSSVTRDSYTKMIRDLERDDFESLIIAKYEGTSIDLMSQGEGKTAYYVLVAMDNDNFGLMEMDGTLDLRYLNTLNNIDFGMLTEQVLGNRSGDKDEEVIEEEDR
jgi:hypothetical protein